MKFPKFLHRLLLDPRFFFFILAFMLIKIWFSNGLLFGGTEAGVPTFEPEKTLSQIIWTWWEAQGPGVAYPVTTASIPLYIMMSALGKVGLNALQIQQVLFFIILYFQGLGVYLLLQKILPNLKKYYLILAGVFYIFNPYLMSHIWHRFIYNNLILAATLPILLYLYLRLIEEIPKKRFRYILLFLLVSLVSNYMYSAVAPILVIWFAIGVFYLVKVFSVRDNPRKMLEVTFSSVLLLVLWFCGNLWWIYPIIQNTTVLNAFSIQGNVNTVIDLSHTSILSYVLRGINSYYMFYEQDWGGIYQNFFFQLLSWVSVLLAIFGYLYYRRKERVYFLVILLLLGLFVSKGAASPLGLVNIFFYEHLFVLGAIRNSFEKVGILIALPLSILAALGVEILWKNYHQRLPRLLIVVSVLACLIYVWPMFSSRLFGSSKYPPYFDPPSEYNQISQFLQIQLEKENGKVLQLPIREGDSVTYKWNHTYNGVDLSSTLFPGSNIAHLSYFSNSDQMIFILSHLFHEPDYPSQKQIMKTMGIKYIVLDKNIDWLARSTDNPVQVEEILDHSPDLTLIKQVGNLKLYALNTHPNPEIIVASGALSVVSPNNLWDIKLNPIWANLSEEEIFFTHYPNSENLTIKQLILPMRQTMKNMGETPKLQDSPKSYAKYLPGSFLYNLVLFKEKFENLFISFNAKLNQEALLTTKRLDEVEKLAKNIDDPNLTQAINSYSSYLDKYLGDNYPVAGVGLTDDQLSLRQTILSKERESLQNLINKIEKNQLKAELKNDVSHITEFQQKEGLEIYYPSVYDAYKNLIGQQIHTYLFNVSHKDTYETLFDIVDPQTFNLSANSTLPIYIDGVLTKVTFKSFQGSFFSLGVREFSAGIHEISIPVPNAISLIDTNPQLLQKHGLVEPVDKNHYKMSSSADYSYISFPIHNYSQNKLYNLNLSYRIIMGNGPTVDILQDRDLLKNDDNPQIRWSFFNDKYYYDFKSFWVSFSNGNYTSAKLDDKTTNAQVRISIPFWNNCEETNSQKKSICLNPAIKREYNKQSVIEIKNLDIAESFSGNLLLAKNNPGNINYQLPKIEFNKISPTEYKVHFNNPNDKFYLVLNESFSEGWQAIFQGDGGNTELVSEKEHILANGYANGWVINKSGAGDLIIRYLPQTYLIKGAYISITTFLIVLVLFGLEVVLRKKKF